MMLVVVADGALLAIIAFALSFPEFTKCDRTHINFIKDDLLYVLYQFMDVGCEVKLGLSEISVSLFFYRAEYFEPCNIAQFYYYFMFHQICC